MNNELLHNAFMGVISIWNGFMLTSFLRVLMSNRKLDHVNLGGRITVIWMQGGHAVKNHHQVLVTVEDLQVHQLPLLLNQFPIQSALYISHLCTIVGLLFNCFVEY